MTGQRDPLVALRAALSRAYWMEWKPGTFTPAVGGPVDAVLRARVLPLVEAAQAVVSRKVYQGEEWVHCGVCSGRWIPGTAELHDPSCMRQAFNVALRTLTNKAVKP